MSELHPYRPLTSPSWREEELWQALDEALGCALQDPITAWCLAWSVLLDAASQQCRAVEVAVSALIDELTGGSRTVPYISPVAVERLRRSIT